MKLNITFRFYLAYKYLMKYEKVKSKMKLYTKFNHQIRIIHFYISKTFKLIYSFKVSRNEFTTNSS